MNKLLKSYLMKQIHSRGYELVRPEDFLIVPKNGREKVMEVIQKLRPQEVGISLKRLGPDGDGGYLIPDDLDGIEACFSPGVSDISGFEEDCAKLGMEVFLADASVSKPMLTAEFGQIHFEKKFIGSKQNQQFMTLQSWVEDSPVKQDSDLILQMDIEGYEYFSLINTPESLISRFRIIVLELHRIQRIWDKDYYNLFTEALDKVLLNHTCVHIHPNNCCGSEKHKGIEIPKIMEFTFIRNDRFSSSKAATVFPHPLDFDNTRKEPLVLPEVWYKPEE